MKMFNGMPTYLPVAVILILGFGFSLAAFYEVQRWEGKRLLDSFQRAGEDRVAAIEQSIAASLEKLEALGAFYAAAKDISRAEFRNFARRVMKGHSTIQALEWIPRVPARLRSAYEQMKQVNEAKDRFVATVSHDFRSPLAIILASAQTILTDNEMPLDMREKFIGRIERAHIAHVAGSVRVAVELGRIGNDRAVVAKVARTIAIAVHLARIGNGRAHIAEVVHASSCGSSFS